MFEHHECHWGITLNLYREKKSFLNTVNINCASFKGGNKLS